MPLKVIGTGFGRTGTDSMRHALNMLGVGPTHHMMELGEVSPLRQPWRDLVDGAVPDWDALFSGYNACVDWPSAHYWRELIVAYPDQATWLLMIGLAFYGIGILLFIPMFALLVAHALRTAEDAGP